MKSIEGQIPKDHIMTHKSSLFYELLTLTHLHTIYCINILYMYCIHMVYQSILVYYKATVYERVTAVSKQNLFPC